MAFTYVGDLSTDLDKVRFYTGDTDSDGYYLEDATITALLSVEASVGGAVIAGIEYIIRKLNQPTFRADWLTVDPKEAVKAWERHLDEMRQRFSVAGRTATVTHIYRADSDQDEEPDYA